ncbi:unnamed protein product [Commensalibacter communis]|uniref:hypothetical protein n=1 Tax=Commensalibacter communis TaxID=2972786 RepID=UPI0022FF5DB4|nr:hypothetical protein [Commensalibacter communis]CAI3945303.1 unnamed protein product [Commensalibacter communis]CAI3946576.1 unnamed protein product [Commensalibacter communis]
MNAKEQFHDGLNAPDGHQNPFILLRRGQILYSLNDSKAIEFLMRAYMLESECIFYGGNPIYLSLVQQTPCE